ncbi:hypothetical protein EUGRSUZ_B03881 [Eucalyptus grandis]|uniref:Uncharacterized protein n=2 Tax=Eucalyptus grandis TaxID=71139 RepID=A0ACC3LXH0_EUCGR|nr:hypothetical protein EUGRSUZ_B03881 [Eucalyptus grandis]
MAKLTARLGMFLVLLLFVVAAEAVPAKKVRCTDPAYPDCISDGLFTCPSGCPQTCTMSCDRCAPVCPRSPPPPAPPPPPPRKQKSPPPPKKRSPPPPPRKQKSPPPPKKKSPPPPSPHYSYPPPPPPAPMVVPPPPSGDVSGQKRARCKNKNYPLCYGVELSCPAGCPTQCEVDCTTCSPVCSCDRPGAVCQDPRFIGGDGVTFYFHGKKDRDFCLVSDSNIHINAHFIGRRNQDMKRDFTWVQSLGILFGKHQLFIGAKKTSTWDDSVDRLSIALDGQSVYLPEAEGEKWQSASSDISITRWRDTNAVEIEVEGNFKIKAVVVPLTDRDSLIHNYGITQENCYAHLDLSFKFYWLSDEVTGVLGQTYAKNYVSRAKMGVAMPVLGGEREFTSSGLFATDCAAARFIGELSLSNSTGNFQYGDLNCSGGEDGPGVVCKR